MILIAYDGSADSQAAIAQAASLFPGASAVVIVVWQRFVDTTARAGIAIGAPTVVDLDEIDGATEKAARETALAGAAQGKEAGLDARGETALVVTNVADALIQEASRLDASAIVMGSRGLTGLKSALLGSVSNAVVHHADRPVVVVPSPEAAAARAKRLARD